MNEFIERIDGNVTYVDFPRHSAAITAEAEHTSRQTESEPLPEELVKIINYLRRDYPDAYMEISTDISYYCGIDTPGHLILQEVLERLETYQPLLFRRISKILA